MVSFGVGISPDFPAREMIELVRLAEELGYDYVWLPEDSMRDIYVTMAVYALNTKTVKLGTAVTNPYTRHPLVTAAAIATADELSDGRAVLGIGAAGGNKERTLGIMRPKPALAIKEMIMIIRELLSGKTVSYDGEVFKVADAKLDFECCRKVPMYIAGRGPLVLQAAGEVADGAMIGAFVSEATLDYALQRIRNGVQRAGRSMDELDIVSWVHTSISKDAEAAREAVAPIVAHVIRSIYLSKIFDSNLLEKTGITESVAKPIIDMLSGEWTTEASRKASKLVPNQVAEHFSLSGTSDEILAKVSKIFDKGIKQVAINPYAPKGRSIREVITDFAENVMANFV